MSKSDVDQTEEGTLKALAAKRARVQIRALGQRIKDARADSVRHRANEAKQHREAQRNDKRVRIPVPAPDAPWLPEMRALNDVLGNTGESEPPVRDIEGTMTRVRARKTGMHALTQAGANNDEREESRLPAVGPPLLTRYNEKGLAELIEKYIDHYDTLRPIRSLRAFAFQFVEHFLTRDDGLLPTVGGIATLPIVLPGSRLLAGPGLDRDRGIIFRVPPELLAMLPTPDHCDDEAVETAICFLTNEWLVDVLCGFIGKTTFLTAAMTEMPVVQRTFRGRLK